MVVFGALNPISLGSVGRGRCASVVTGAAIGTRPGLLPGRFAGGGDAEALLFRVRSSSSSLLGGVLKGDTLRCPIEDAAVAIRPRSAEGLIPRGLAGIFGLSARLTGGGMGDLGRAGGCMLLELTFSGAAGETESLRCGADGEDCLVEELL